MVVEGRVGQALNLAGEKTPEASLVAAVAAAAQALLPGGAAGLQEWAAREVLHPRGGAEGGAGHYLVYWELTGAPAAASSRASTGGAGGSPGAPIAAVLAGWAERLEQEVGRCAPQYRAIRQEGSVAGLQLKLVAPGAFGEIRCAVCVG